ncbi:MAG: hypothetical protein ACRDNK_10165 [Solirubrobacteraceae bacterium]
MPAIVRRGVLVALTYLTIAVVATADVWDTPTTRYVGSIPDALQSIWFLSWTAHALAHHQSLVFTHAMNAPYGVNLLWNTGMLLPGVLATPLTLTLGPVFAYNILALAALSTSASAGYVAINHFTHHYLASWFGGLLFGFSPFVTAQLLGHLDLMVLFYPAVVLILFDEIVIKQQRRSWMTGAALGVLTAAQFFIFEELVVSVGICFAAGLIVACVEWRSDVATHWGYLAKALAVATATSALCIGWAVWFQVRGPLVPPGLSEVANATGNDVLAFVTPTAGQLASPVFAHDVAARFAAQSIGQGSYLGVPLILLLALIIHHFWAQALIRLLAITAVLSAVLSMGSPLNILGWVSPVPLPWVIFGHLPVVSNLIPLRFVVFTFLCAGTLVGYGLAQLRNLKTPRAAAVLVLTTLVLISWWPRYPLPSLSVPTPAELPAAISSRIPEGGTVLFAPYPSYSAADAMYYQLESGFKFSLVKGYAYQMGPDLPLQSALDGCGEHAIHHATQQIGVPTIRSAVVRAYVALGTTDIVVPPGPCATAFVLLFTNLLQSRPLTVGGFATWDLRPGR